MALDSLEDRRRLFATWLTSPDNEYFAKNIVNRVWGNIMGRGLCHPIDDVRATNPASNEELLSARKARQTYFDFSCLLCGFAALREVLSSATFAP